MNAPEGVLDAALEEYSGIVLGRAEGLMNKPGGMQHHPTYDERWDVFPDGPSGDRHYTVTVAYGAAMVLALCSCDNGKAQGGQGKCYHKAAVLKALRGDF